MSPGSGAQHDRFHRRANSTPLERDARLINADERPVAPSEIAIGVVIGRTSEFFDFFVYAIASVLVFPSLLFPFVDALTGTLYSFALFALAFIARPVGTLIFMAIDRRYGRGVKLTIALFLLGGSTTAIAFLPGYARSASPHRCSWRCSASARAWRWAAPGTACPRCSR